MRGREMIEAGIPVHASNMIYEAKIGGQATRNDIVGIIKQEEISDYVSRRRDSADSIPSGLKAGEYILMVGALKVFLSVDDDLIESLESANDRSGKANTLAGIGLLHALQLI